MRITVNDGLSDFTENVFLVHLGAEDPIKAEGMSPCHVTHFALRRALCRSFKVKATYSYGNLVIFISDALLIGALLLNLVLGPNPTDYLYSLALRHFFPSFSL